MAKVNFFVSATDDPCGFDHRDWFVTIFDCHGNVLEWRGKKYVVLKAPRGHLEIEVPPGCYYAKASWSWSVTRPGLVWRVNHWTDAAIFQARCAETTCVKLFNPSAHRCGYIYLRALKDLVAQKVIKPNLVNPIEEAVEAINQQLGRPAMAFELGRDEEFAKLMANQKDDEDCCTEEK